MLTNQEHGLVDRLTDGDEAVIGQDRGLGRADGGGDALALFDVVSDTAVTVIQAVVFEEDAGVLGEGPQRPVQGGKGLAVNRVRVGRGYHVGAGRMDLRVDGEGCLVQRPGASQNGAGMVDEDQVRARICLKLIRTG